MKKLATFCAMVVLATPSVVSAQQTPTTFKELVAFILGYINILVPVIITAAVVYYMWHTAQGLRNTKDGRMDPNWQQGMIWGVLALALMVSLWGVLSILTATFGIPVMRP